MGMIAEGGSGLSDSSKYAKPVSIDLFQNRSLRDVSILNRGGLSAPLSNFPLRSQVVTYPRNSRFHGTGLVLRSHNPRNKASDEFLDSVPIDDDVLNFNKESESRHAVGGSNKIIR
jgi:hypothetical protein